MNTERMFECRLRVMLLGLKSALEYIPAKQSKDLMDRVDMELRLLGTNKNSNMVFLNKVHEQYNLILDTLVCRIVKQ